MAHDRHWNSISSYAAVCEVCSKYLYSCQHLASVIFVLKHTRTRDQINFACCVCAKLRRVHDGWWLVKIVDCEDILTNGVKTLTPDTQSVLKLMLCRHCVQIKTPACSNLTWYHLNVISSEIQRHMCIKFIFLYYSNAPMRKGMFCWWHLKKSVRADCECYTKD